MVVRDQVLVLIGYLRLSLVHSLLEFKHSSSSFLSSVFMWPLTILCMFHETIWTHLLVLPVLPAQRLPSIIHHRDKSYPFCYSQNTFHCQSLAYSTVMPDGWFTPLLFLQRCRRPGINPLTLQAAKCYNVRSDTQKRKKDKNIFCIIWSACVWKMWLQYQYYYIFISVCTESCWLIMYTMSFYVKPWVFWNTFRNA